MNKSLLEKLNYEFSLGTNLNAAEGKDATRRHKMLVEIGLTRLPLSTKEKQNKLYGKFGTKQTDRI